MAEWVKGEHPLEDSARTEGEDRWLSRSDSTWTRNFLGPVSRALVRHGVDAPTAPGSRSLLVRRDPEQVAFATVRRPRVMVTFDPDFQRSYTKSGAEHGGIAWCPERKYRIGELIQDLLLHGVLDGEAMRNHLGTGEWTRLRR